MAIVEFALILPLLILLMVGLFDLGFGLFQSMQVHAAAEAGAQYAARHSYPWDPTAIALAVTSATGTGGSSACPPPTGNISACPAPSRVCGCPDVTPLAVANWAVDHCTPTVTCPSGSAPGVYASVSAQLSYSPLLSYPGLPATLTLTGQAYRRID